VILYDETRSVASPTAEMHRVTSRFSTPGSRTCASLEGGFETFRSLYPFVCTQADIRSAVDREKYLTIYPSAVLDNKLYLGQSLSTRVRVRSMPSDSFVGTGHQATDWKIVRDLKLTHIINISVEHQCVFRDKIQYLHLELEDEEHVALCDRFAETNQFMATALDDPTSRILVHCNLGISRSSSVILAYLMKTFHAALFEAFKFLRHRRPIVCPNLGFLQQLIEFEYELFSKQYSDPNDPMFH
jgi:serine/threonine/tyrosine-interacting-like protein 1